MTRRGSAALLAAAYLAAVGLVAVAAAHDTKTAQGGHAARSGVTLGDPRLSPILLAGVKERHGTEPSPYWRAERKLVAALKAQGRLGAEVRRLRRESRGLQMKARALQAVHASPVGASGLELNFLCIHGGEGSWTDPNAPYFGGLQMDSAFMAAYGPEFLRAWGTADHWPVSVQIAVAIRAYLSGRGFYPWPRTARACGLIR